MQTKLYAVLKDHRIGETIIVDEVDTKNTEAVVKKISDFITSGIPIDEVEAVNDAGFTIKFVLLTRHEFETVNPNTFM